MTLEGPGKSPREIGGSEFDREHAPIMRNMSSMVEGPIGVVFFDTQPGAGKSRDVQTLGAFRSADDFEKFISALAESSKATREGSIVKYPDGRVYEYMRIPVGEYFQSAGPVCVPKAGLNPVAIFQCSADNDWIPIPIGSYGTAREFMDVVRAAPQFLNESFSGSLQLGAPQAALTDSVSPIDYLRERDFIVISAENFITPP